MAPIKFEEDIKKKLEGRTINPSESAWSSLSNRLDAQDKNNSKAGYWWFGIAASVLAIAFVSVLYLNKNTNVVEPIIVIETPEVLNNEEKQQVIKNEIKPELVETKVEETTEKQLSTKAFKEQKAVKKTTTNNQTNLVANTEENSTESSKNNIIKNEVDKGFEANKVQEVVAQIQELQITKETVTDAEIDSLLTQAQNTIAVNNSITENKKSIDATALLESVETDLEHSFRDKVFQKLKTGYNTVKTAVVERND